MKIETGKKRLIMKRAAVAAGLSVALLLTLQCLDAFAPSGNIPPAAQGDFALMAEAWNTIQAHYVDRPALKPVALTYGAITGMVDALGDTGHSTFLSPQMLKQEEAVTKGKFEGIGVEVRMKSGRVVIVAPIDGSPAQEAGIQAGEVIMAVDGRDIAGLTLMQAVALITGPAGSRVKLTILSPDTGRTRVVELVRQAFTVDNVTWCRLPGTQIAHLRIAAFSNGVSADLKKALEEIGKNNLKGIVLDLRNDPGGLFNEAVSSASQFLSQGNVLLVKDAAGKVSPVSVEKGGAALQTSMVGLVNNGSASASEIVAGALMDHGRALLIGTTTFGTGTLLKSFPLSDGSALLLAVEEWLTPDGRTIWHKGITPNIEKRLPAGVFPLFPDEERTMTHEQLMQSKDVQLLEALDVLGRKVG